jgi:hypothetical protein
MKKNKILSSFSSLSLKSNNDIEIGISPIEGALKHSEKSAGNVILKNPIYHARWKTIGRSDGRSALAAAAYRADERMYLEDNIHAHSFKYKRKTKVRFSKILAPANAPHWASIRNKLWLEAAKAEKRIDSVEAREFEFSIPYEIPFELAKEICLRLAWEMISRHRVVIDLNIHDDDRFEHTGAQKNHEGLHCHFLMTTREITESGLGDKTRELELSRYGWIKFWRVRWAELANDCLESIGSKSRISSLSNRERGVRKLPTKSLGPALAALEKRGVQTTIGDYNRKVLELNEQL